MMKVARKLLKWIRGNLRWILVGLAALGIVVGGVVERWNYSTRAKHETERSKQENETLREAIRNQEKKISEMENRKVETTTETVYVKTFDPKTGKLLKETRTELSQVKEENDRLRKESGKMPVIRLPTGWTEKKDGLYPFGGFLAISPAGEIGGGIKWRLVPRLALPFVPDLSLVIGAGYHRDSLIGLVLVDFHR